MSGTLDDWQTHVWHNEKFGPWAGQVVDVVARLLSSRYPERLHVDLAKVGVTRTLLEGQDQLDRIFSHQLDHLLVLPADDGLVVHLDDLVPWLETSGRVEHSHLGDQVNAGLGTLDHDTGLLVGALSHCCHVQACRLQYQRVCELLRQIVK